MYRCTMLFLSRSIAVICVHFLIIAHNKHTINGQGVENEGNKSVLSANSKIFKERRNEHQTVIKNMITSENYEKNFKLLKLAYGQIFQLIRDSNITMTSYAYEPLRDGFAQNSNLQDAVSTVMENCCIAAESLIHFPEISYRIFGKQYLEWKLMLNWCYEFVNSFPHIIDESTAKLMTILFQEINEEFRNPEYVNPYHEASKHQEKKKENKRHKKLKKGPSLSGGKKEL
ncbi:uncharacterized protein LOC126767677 isoform X2 [Bactrocera neohumeralis]|uniref:uncharacterized protein LOC120782712 isoform X2 n=1 Tax=Bactrocera tryoni TaxID=59916 RepID=UPI001A979BA0|nr:uncharacterized protein LOC120782712 isoform X2 [Bactrocera tryoni]XP_050341172.1 uncharacterized protein LOC126767677 isoform X2 [Bactrocera neohumeralis]